METPHRVARTWQLFVSLSLLLSPGGCGGYSNGEEPAASNEEWSAFAATLARAHCSSIQSCCAQAALDSSKCESSLRSVLETRLNSLAGKRGIAFDAAAGARLVEFVQTVNRACGNKALAESGTTAWNDVFRGTIPPGASCLISQECVKTGQGQPLCSGAGYYNGTVVSGNVCSSATNLSIPPRAALGQECSRSCKDAKGACANGPGFLPCLATDGLYCKEGKCAGLAKIGQPCADDLCENGGHCDSGLCVANTADGVCSGDDQCALSSYCDQDQLRCKPQKSRDKECVLDSECEGGSCDQGRCNSWSVATTKTCAGTEFSGEVETERLPGVAP